jgi:glycosyltransferase involved in cell wall biosynthesis
MGLEMSDSVPKTTVGLTSFNAELTIEKAIQSARSQNWSNLEIVIVDDCSTDGSWEIITRIADQDPRVKAVCHSINGGPAAARNTILETASGEFVAFFDDDDESLPDRIHIQYETLRAYEVSYGVELVACYASGLRRYTNGYELLVDAIGSRPEVPQGEVVADYLLFNGRRHGVFYGAGTPTCSLLARLSTFRAVGGFDNSLRRVEDVDFAIRLAMLGGHFIGCPDRLYMQHATATADKTPKKNLEAELHLVEKYSAYLLRKKRYSYARDWFQVRFYHFNGEYCRFISALIMFLFRYPLNGIQHLLCSAPARLRHENKMNSNL